MSIQILYPLKKRLCCLFIVGIVRAFVYSVLVPYQKCDLQVFPPTCG